jgi:hypothetical protein
MFWTRLQSLRKPEPPKFYQKPVGRIKMTSIYVVSTLDRIKEHTFKVGKHSGSQQKLLSRYKTPLIEPLIIYFRPSVQSSEIEKQVLSQLDQYRIKDQDNKKTEWVKLDSIEIIKIIDCVGKTVDSIAEKAANPPKEQEKNGLFGWLFGKKTAKPVEPVLTAKQEMEKIDELPTEPAPVARQEIEKKVELTKKVSFIIDEKKCDKCENTKKLKEFPKDRYSKDGYHACCMACRRELLRKRHEEKQQKSTS